MLLSVGPSLWVGPILSFSQVEKGDACVDFMHGKCSFAPKLREFGLLREILRAWVTTDCCEILPRGGGRGNERFESGTSLLTVVRVTTLLPPYNGFNPALDMLRDRHCGGEIWGHDSFLLRSGVYQRSDEWNGVFFVVARYSPRRFRQSSWCALGDGIGAS